MGKRPPPIRVRREKDGKLRVTLDLDLAGVLFELPGRLRRLLTRPDFSEGVAAKLFPRAYKSPSEEEEYRRLLGDDLRRRKLSGIDLFEETLRNAKRLRSALEVSVTPEEFEMWLGFVNDMRLVLGTELEITQENWESTFDPTQPKARDFALLHCLSWLEEELLRALS